MLKRLTELIERSLATSEEATSEQREHSVQLATALLLVEVARADCKVDIREHRELVTLLESNFDLSKAEIELLIEEAKAEADHAASLQAFTRRLHEELTLKEKHRIVEMLWRVAHADNHLDKHEDHLVRKIAGLLYVSHKDLIRIRNRVSKRYR